MIVGDVFEPARFSDEELAFLDAHLEEPPLVALHEGAPQWVNPAAITQTLSRLQELQQLQAGRGVPWAGFDAIRDSIARYQTWQKRSAEIFRRTGGPHSNSGVPHASQFAWDKRGRHFRFGIGADSADMVRTEILPDGSRRAFAVPLLDAPGGLVEVLDEQTAPWLHASTEPGADLPELKTQEDGDYGQIQCPICGQTETYTVANRATFLNARKRMSTHLLKARTDIERHRQLHTAAFR